MKNLGIIGGEGSKLDLHFAPDSKLYVTNAGGVPNNLSMELAPPIFRNLNREVLRIEPGGTVEYATDVTIEELKAAIEYMIAVGIIHVQGKDEGGSLKP